MKKVIIYSVSTPTMFEYFTDKTNAIDYCAENDIDTASIQTGEVSISEAEELWESGQIFDSNDDERPLFQYVEDEEADEPEEEEEEEEEEKEAPKAAPGKSLDKMTKAELLGQLQNLAVQVAQLQQNSTKPQKLSFEELKKQYEEKSRLLGLRDTLKNELNNIKGVFFAPDHTHPFQINGFSIAFMKENQMFLKLQSAFILEKFKNFIIAEMQNEIQLIESKI